MIENNSKFKQKSTLYILIALWKRLSKKRKFQIYLLSILIFISSILEILTLASVIPFIYTLIGSNNNIINFVLIPSGLNFDNNPKMISLIFSFFIISSSFIRIFNIWANGQLAGRIGTDLSYAIFNNIIYEKYENQIQIKSSDIISTVTNDVSRVVYGVLNPLFNLVSALAISSTIILSLLFINKNLIILPGIIILIIYVIIALYNRKKLFFLSKSSSLHTTNLVKSVQDSLGSIRNIVLDNRYNFFKKKFRENDLGLRLDFVNGAFISAYPRFIVEAIGIVSISVTATFLLLRGIESSILVAQIGSFALGFQRLLPNLQKIYEGWSETTNNSYSLQKVLNLNIRNNKNVHINDNFYSDQMNINSKFTIKFENVTYKFKKSKKPIIKNISITFKSDETIGISGKTGEGKSTFLDLLMGLLEPSEGKILINGHDIWAVNGINLRKKWYSYISHVPQSIYLADTTIKNNIAFGIDEKNVDHKRVYYAAKNAWISDFIEELPDRYETQTGEKASNLSGGQAQRIGIARALFKLPKLLVLDEATSALDNETEKKVISSLSKIRSKPMIIMVAHRLDSLFLCDRFIKLSKGKILELNKDEIV